MKAILIARVSTEEQKEAGNSLPAQIARLERYCQSKGFQVIKVCSFDESAYSNDRSDFDRIIDFILNQQEKVAICCDKVDRLSRNVFDKRISILYEKALRDEIELHFASDGQVINSRISAVEKFQFSISLGLAKYYSDAISDNVKRAIEQKLRKGEWPSKAPYGYKNITKDDEKTDIIVDDYEAGIVQKIFELYASRAYSMQLLCQKIKDTYGLNWSKGFLDHILKNTFYCGVMKWNNKEYPHRYPIIISPSLFEQVQQVKEGFNKKPFKFAGLPYIYRGLLRCADCGLAITPEKHKGYIYYHCTQSKGKHGAKWLREEAITEQVATVFKNLHVPKDILTTIVDTLNAVQQEKMDFHNKEVEKLNERQKTLTTMMDNLYLDRLKGRITDSEYDRFYQMIKDESIDVSIRLEQFQEAQDNYFITAKYILDLANRAYDLFMSSEVEERRLLITLVLLNLRVSDEKVLYDVRKPFDAIINCNDRQAWRAR